MFQREGEERGKKSAFIRKAKAYPEVFTSLPKGNNL